MQPRKVIINVVAFKKCNDNYEYLITKLVNTPTENSLVAMIFIS